MNRSRHANLTERAAGAGKGEAMSVQNAWSCVLGSLAALVAGGGGHGDSTSRDGRGGDGDGDSTCDGRSLARWGLIVIFFPMGGRPRIEKRRASIERSGFVVGPINKPFWPPESPSTDRIRIRPDSLDPIDAGRCPIEIGKATREWTARQD